MAKEHDMTHLVALTDAELAQIQAQRDKAAQEALLSRFDRKSAKVMHEAHYDGGCQRVKVGCDVSGTWAAWQEWMEVSFDGHRTDRFWNSKLFCVSRDFAEVMSAAREKLKRARDAGQEIVQVEGAL